MPAAGASAPIRTTLFIHTIGYTAAGIAALTGAAARLPGRASTTGAPAAVTAALFQFAIRSTVGNLHALPVDVTTVLGKAGSTGATTPIIATHFAAAGANAPRHTKVVLTRPQRAGATGAAA